MSSGVSGTTPRTCWTFPSWGKVRRTSLTSSRGFKRTIISCSHKTITGSAPIPRTAGVLWLKDESMTPGQQVTAIRVIATLLSAADLNGEYVEVAKRWLNYIE